MARISNQSTYPLDDSPDVNDYLIGTDYHTQRRTRTYPIWKIGKSLGLAGVKVQEVYLGFCPFSTSDVALSVQINTFLALHSINVDFSTLIIFKVLHHNVDIIQGHRIIPTQTNYYFPVGYGSYDPLSDYVQFADLIIDYEKPATLTLQAVISSPDAAVLNLGDISGEVLVTYLNGGNYDLSDATKTHYFRFTQDNIEYLYVFNVNGSANGSGIYGLAEFQFSANELLLIFDNSLDYTVSGGDLPSQTGNEGKYLTTNGTVASWENAPSVGASSFNKVLLWDGDAIAVPSGFSGSILNFSRSAMATYTVASTILTVTPADADSGDILIITSN